MRPVTTRSQMTPANASAANPTSISAANPTPFRHAADATDVTAPL